MAARPSNRAEHSERKPDILVRDPLVDGAIVAVAVDGSAAAAAGDNDTKAGRLLVLVLNLVLMLHTKPVHPEMFGWLDTTQHNERCSLVQATLGFT